MNAESSYPITAYSSVFDIRQLQEMLIATGYLFDVDCEYGVFDSATTDAVIRFQQEHSLVCTDSANPAVSEETWNALVNAR